MDLQKTQENGYQINNLHDRDYFAFKAVSSHGMIDIIKNDYDVDMASLPKELPQRSLEMGSIIHGAILEPHRIVEICEENYTSLEMPGDMGVLLKMVQAAFTNDHIRNCLEKTVNELTLLYTREGLASIKGKTDAIDVDKGMIYDVKSISRIGYRKGHIKNFGYNFQAALYTRLAELVYGKPFKFQWWFISKDKGEVAIENYKPQDEHMEAVRLAIEAYDNYHLKIGTKFSQFPTEKKEDEKPSVLF